jgi:hypothetical protein
MIDVETKKEGIWIKKFIEELDMVPSIEVPLKLFYDNSGAITHIKESKARHRIKIMVKNTLSFETS